MTATKGRACTGKQRHETKQAAAGHRRHLVRNGGVRLSVYECPHCGGWHVGHKQRRRR